MEKVVVQTNYVQYMDIVCDVHVCVYVYVYVQKWCEMKPIKGDVYL